MDSILIVEDLAPTRDWLHALVRRVYPNAQIIGCATLRAGYDWLAQQQPDGSFLGLIDLGLPDGSGVDLIRQLRLKLPDARIIVSTLYDDDAHILAALAAGATGYLLKDEESEIIEARLRGMERGEVAMTPSISRRILEHFRKNAGFFAVDSAVLLTPREMDVLRLIGRGLKVAEAAASLGISAQTTAGYIKSVYRKLDVNTRAEAALEAAKRGLV
ncbi:DNA-binding NarL/FixJ family response regulator [Sphingobium sp. B11D3B]|uniref:response regulator n=1 Tax=Sphingobium sp. B11D3B TaxID=2940575 RepID=UPI0022266F81|nr:response regulator transcription factor [Sphingobium sp. B11D3B]MCW2389603.1 DNA-binding NarL/FixJ family response regulator [Sphingobium sp. B11D3B]